MGGALRCDVVGRDKEHIDGTRNFKFIAEFFQASEKIRGRKSLFRPKTNKTYNTTQIMNPVLSATHENGIKLVSEGRALQDRHCLVASEIRSDRINATKLKLN